MGNANCAGAEENKKEFLSQQSLEFIVEKTQASTEEIQEQYKNFIEIYPDGRIDKKGFSTMLKKCFPEEDLAKFEKHIFRMYDMNQDGKVDFREFMIILTVIGTGTPHENLEQIFRIFDVDNNGTISKKELAKVIKDLFHILSHEDNPTNASDQVLAELAFKEMDTDGDSKVTKEEFIRASLGNEKITSMLALKIVDIFV